MPPESTAALMLLDLGVKRGGGGCVCVGIKTQKNIKKDKNTNKQKESERKRHIERDTERQRESKFPCSCTYCNYNNTGEK